MVVRVIQTTAASAAITLPWIPLNMQVEDPQIQWHFNRTGNGTADLDVEYTLDNVLDPDVSAVAINEASVATATAASMDHPAMAIRLAVASASGNNVLTFRVLQAGI